MVDLWLPEGATMAQTRRLAKRFEARMMQETGVKSVTTWIGSGVPRFYLPLDQVFPQTNVRGHRRAGDLKVRESLRKKLPALMATEFPELRARVKLLPNGPPVPYPVQFRVVGPDAEQVRKWGDEAKACCAPTRTCAASTTTGTRTCRRCGWTSTRTRHARWA